MGIDSFNQSVKNQQLRYYVKRGDTDAVIDLLKGGFFTPAAEINSQNDDGETALILAVKHEHIDVVKALLKKGADISLRDKTGSAAMNYAVKTGNKEILKLLFDTVLSAENFDKSDVSLLVTAIMEDNFDLARVLIENGIDINGKDKNGVTPLKAALVNPNAQDILQLLLYNYKNANVCFAETPEKSICLAVDWGNIKVTRLLLEQGVDVNTVWDNGDSLLMTAVQKRNEPMTLFLLENGADVNVCNKDGIPLLLLAVSQENSKIIQYLIDYHTPVNVAGENGGTPLMWAAELQNTKPMRILIENGADVHTRDKYGCSALFYAKTPESVRILLDKNADIRLKGFWQRTVLSFMILEGASQEAIAELLKCDGISDIINEPDKDGNTSFMIACEKDDKMKIADLLIKYGADPNAQNNEGYTVLMKYAELGRFSRLKEFIENYHINLNLQNQNGETALILAAKHNHNRVVEYLIECGADCEICDNRNKTAIDYLEEENPALALKLYKKQFKHVFAERQEISDCMDKFNVRLKKNGKNDRLKEMINQLDGNELVQMLQTNASFFQQILMTGLILDAFQKMSYDETMALYQSTQHKMKKSVQEQAQQIIREKRQSQNS